MILRYCLVHKLICIFYLLKPGQDGFLIRQFKLWLAKEEDTIASPPPPLLEGQEPVDAIADYLRLFHESVIEQMMITSADVIQWINLVM